MSNNSNKNIDIPYNLKEILDNLDKTKIVTPEEKKRIEESLNFESAIENIDISDNDNRVIFTDGENQLIYEDGEFFLVSSTDSLKTKKKKKREEARNMYIEYFIKYQLNPILEQRRITEMARTISVKEPVKNKQKDIPKKDVKKELGNNVKSAPDRESDLSNKKPKEVTPKQKSR